MLNDCEAIVMLDGLVFVPATSTAYNAAVARVKAAGETLARQQARAQAQAQVLAQKRDAIYSASGSVRTDFTSVGSDITNVQSDLSNVVNDLANERNDLSSAQKDLQTALADSADQRCGDAAIVASDAQALHGDAERITGGDAQMLSGDFATMSRDIAQLQSNFQALEVAEGNLPSYRPQDTPTAAGVSRAVSQASVASAREALARYTGQARQMAARADAYAAQAQAACKKVGG